MNSDEYRHECEVRYWVDRMQAGGFNADDWQKRIARKRGAEAAKRLRNDCREEMRRRREK